MERAGELARYHHPSPAKDLGIPEESSLSLFLSLPLLHPLRPQF